MTIKELEEWLHEQPQMFLAVQMFHPHNLLVYEGTYPYKLKVRSGHSFLDKVDEKHALPNNKEESVYDSFADKFKYEYENRLGDIDAYRS